MSEEKLHFETDATKLLHLVVHSLYSEKQIFLRELISNASDACDRLRYQALTEPALTADDTEFKITITIHKSARTLEVADNGIGMSRDDLVRELGTIARSGTSAFLDQLTGDAKKDVALIGQFGVGFYSTFMIADQVEVTSRKAGEDKAWRWQSDGKEDYSVSDAERLVRGTSVTLHLRPDEDEFLKPERLGTIVKTYSDHIALPIILVQDGNEETMNSASALWTRPRNEISEDQYKEFYHHTGHAFDEPWATIHYKAEGTMEYTALVFIPSTRPFDLFTPERAHRVKLYVKRVFITDQCEALVPPYLRFLRGLVDSEDLPLNVSREMLQSSPLGRANPLGDRQTRFRRSREEGRGTTRGIRNILGEFRGRSQGRDLRRRRPKRYNPETRTIPLDRGRAVGKPRRLCRAHEGRPAGNLLHHR